VSSKWRKTGWFPAVIVYNFSYQIFEIIILLRILVIWRCWQIDEVNSETIVFRMRVLIPRFWYIRFTVIGSSYSFNYSCCRRIGLCCSFEQRILDRVCMHKGLNNGRVCRCFCRLTMPWFSRKQCLSLYYNYLCDRNPKITGDCEDTCQMICLPHS
jgi:hypothetical protein